MSKSKQKEKKSIPILLLKLVFGSIIWLILLPFKILWFIVSGIFSLIIKRSLPKNGREYEMYCVKLLRKAGYKHITTTKATGDHGVDIIAFAGKKMYAIQCKFYSGKVGNHAVMEAYTGCAFYECDVPVVLTNTTFTRQAIEESEKLGVLLWSENQVKKVGFFAGLFSPDKDRLLQHVTDVYDEEIYQIDDKEPDYEADYEEADEYEEELSSEHTDSKEEFVIPVTYWDDDVNK